LCQKGIREETPMAQSAGLHEPAEAIGEATVDRHRATTSIQEELEAVDWYDQRADATGDEALREILVHNRDEEKEHASMALEWLRRHDSVLDQHLRTYLFSEGSITEEEEEAAQGDQPAAGSLGIGSLRMEVAP
jgi:ferritin-like protein